MVLDGYGVHIELHGETFINGKTGVTSATFRNTPDVPFESIEVNIPTGRTASSERTSPQAPNTTSAAKTHDANPLRSQNGLEIHQNTPVAIGGCAKTKATRAQKLAAAMKACKHKPKTKRAACARAARKKYGAKTSGTPKRHSKS